MAEWCFKQVLRTRAGLPDMSYKISGIASVCRLLAAEVCSRCQTDYYSAFTSASTNLKVGTLTQLLAAEEPIQFINQQLALHQVTFIIDSSWFTPGCIQPLCVTVR